MRYIFVIITRTRDLPESRQKIEGGFEKGKRANRAAPGIEKDRKIFDHLLCGASNAELCFSTTNFA